MEKDLHLISLFEEYKELLTKNQEELFNLYFLLDLSLGEIAEIKGISRQGVLDSINKAKDQLIDIENKIQLVANKKKIIESIKSKDLTKDEIIKLIEEI